MYYNVLKGYVSGPIDVDQVYFLNVNYMKQNCIHYTIDLVNNNWRYYITYSSVIVHYSILDIIVMLFIFYNLL